MLRERQRKLHDENELLRTRLRETNESVIKSDGKQNSMIRELKIATEQSDRYLEELGKLSKRVSQVRVVPGPDLRGPSDLSTNWLHFKSHHF